MPKPLPPEDRLRGLCTSVSNVVYKKIVQEAIKAGYDKGDQGKQNKNRSLARFAGSILEDWANDIILVEKDENRLDLNLG